MLLMWSRWNPRSAISSSSAALSGSSSGAKVAWVRPPAGKEALVGPRRRVGCTTGRRGGQGPALSSRAGQSELSGALRGCTLRKLPQLAEDTS